MANCKSCNEEIEWDPKIRRQLGINKPAQLVDGVYVEHDCPAYKSLNNPTASTYKGKTSNTVTTVSNFNKYPNPNNYTGSMSDYANKSQPVMTTSNQTPLTTESVRQLLSEIDVSEDIDFLRGVVINLTENVNKLQITVDNFVKDNPAYRAMLEFQARMFPVLNQLEEKSQQQRNNSDFQTADKIKQRFHENYEADIDPVYDKDYKDSIKGKEEVEDV
jgi:hypothetical protein